MQGRIALAVGLWLAASHGFAHAQTAADKAAADTLFNEGKKLIAAGDAAGACAMFEASLAKATQLGTQLALASCYEKLGKTASALGEFHAAASAAAKAHDKRQRFAEDHVAALEPRLSKIAIKLEPGYRVDGLDIKRDGAAVSAAELGTQVPVDPGDHVVEASAPGWVAWSTKVAITAPGVVEVVVPALGKAPVKVEEPRAEEPRVEPAPVTRPAEPDAGRSRRLVAYGVGGGGAAIVGVSLVLGAMASSRWSDAKAHCRDGLCDSTGVDQAHGAQSMGNLSTAAFLVGTAAVATGVVLYLTARPGDTETPTPDRSALRIVPGVGPDQVGLVIQGGF
jgi:serine/threonine-protein kinase